jgi:hypothetical protein
MKEKRIIQAILAAAVSGIFAPNAFAQTVGVVIPEVENNAIASAQEITSVDSNNCVEITGWLGVAKGDTTIAQDADFYKFRGKNGAPITVDIDRGAGFGDGVDTWIGLFGPGPSYRLKRSNDDIPRTETLDDGSSNRMDARIGYVRNDGTVVAPFTLDEDGVWTVGVSSGQRHLTHEGLFSSTSPALGSNSVGDYALIICGIEPIKPEAMQVKIDVKPSARKSDPVVNPKAKGVLPVALLGSQDFNPFKIDVQSLRFGATGTEASLHRCNNEPQDVNKDGHADRLCHFHNELANFDDDHDTGMLKGNMNAESGGMQFEGNGELKVIPKKYNH